VASENDLICREKDRERQQRLLWKLECGIVGPDPAFIIRCALALLVQKYLLTGTKVQILTSALLNGCEVVGYTKYVYIYI
jgi:hypothetical protein